MTTPDHRTDADQPRGGVRGKLDELLHGRSDERHDGADARTDRLTPPGGQVETGRAPVGQPDQGRAGAPQDAAQHGAPAAGPTVAAPAARPADGTPPDGTPPDGTLDRDRRPDQDGRLGSEGGLDQDRSDNDGHRAVDPTANAAGPAGVTGSSPGSRTVDVDRTAGRPNDDRPDHATAAPSAMGDDADGRASLVPAARVREYGARWDAVKGAFVDEPRQAVAQADALVGELLDELERLFRDQRRDLEHGLDTEETSTEDLRLALRRYRSFFDRLLTL